MRAGTCARASTTNGQIPEMQLAELRGVSFTTPAWFNAHGSFAKLSASAYSDYESASQRLGRGASAPRYL
jgi:hypothetical protein